jgi:molybdenum cofactor cytidylyltransferase
MRPDRQGPVAGVVLAAGMSTRMGENKLLLRLGGATVLRNAVGTALSAGLSPVLVVLGHESQRTRAELEGLPCTPLVNPDYAQGINTSLRAGFRALPDALAGAVALLADMPFVTATMVCRLVDRFRAGREPLVISTYDGVVAPPALYGRALFDEVRALEGEGCGKRVIKAHRSEAAEIAWPGAALADLDVPEDLARARAELGG